VPQIDTKLRQLAKTQLFALDLRATAAPSAVAAHLGGPDAQTPTIWRDADSELLIFPGETRVRFAPGFVFVELRVACDQTGHDSLLLTYRVGSSPNEAVTTAVCESVPRGNAIVASRWGTLATTIVWNAILRAGNDLLARRKLDKPMIVAGVYTLGKVLTYLATAPVEAATLRRYFAETLKSDVVPDLSVLNRRFLGALPINRSKKR
jgi:hypothetical protein